MISFNLVGKKMLIDWWWNWPLTFLFDLAIICQRPLNLLRQRVVLKRETNVGWGSTFSHPPSPSQKWPKYDARSTFLLRVGGRKEGLLPPVTGRLLELAKSFHFVEALRKDSFFCKPFTYSIWIFKHIWQCDVSLSLFLLWFIIIKFYRSQKTSWIGI